MPSVVTIAVLLGSSQSPARNRFASVTLCSWIASTPMSRSVWSAASVPTQENRAGDGPASARRGSVSSEARSSCVRLVGFLPARVRRPHPRPQHRPDVHQRRPCGEQPLVTVRCDHVYAARVEREPAAQFRMASITASASWARARRSRRRVGRYARASTGDAHGDLVGALVDLVRQPVERHARYRHQVGLRHETGSWVKAVAVRHDDAAPRGLSRRQAR